VFQKRVFSAGRGESPENRVYLLVYLTQPSKRPNDEFIETVSLNGSKGDAFVDVNYVIPSAIVKSSDGVYNVKFKAHENSIAGGIYYIRLLKE
jgi:hypothetical protein